MALADHRSRVERAARDRNCQKEVSKAYGAFIARLACWDWFLNPITFRDPLMCPQCRFASSNLYRLASHLELAHQRPFVRDSLRPTTMGAPPRDLALDWLKDWLKHLEQTAEQRIGWMIAEEFGRVGGRWHCHGLVTGVGHLRRTECWQEPFNRFGRSRIEPFDPQLGGAFYAAKYAAKQLGHIHFGGLLQGVDFSHEEAEPIGEPHVHRIQYPPITDPFFLNSRPYKNSLKKLHR